MQFQLAGLHAGHWLNKKKSNKFSLSAGSNEVSVAGDRRMLSPCHEGYIISNSIRCPRCFVTSAIIPLVILTFHEDAVQFKS